MPANLGTLPPELLLRVAQFFDIVCLHGSYFEAWPVPQFYLRLAQVNRQFYRVFTSDTLWSKLDVHSVEQNIAAYYLKQKKRMPLKELVFCGGFDFESWQHPKLTKAEFDQCSLYTKASLLCNITETVATGQLWSKIDCWDSLAHAARSRCGLCYATEELLDDLDFMMRVAAAGG